MEKNSLIKNNLFIFKIKNIFYKIIKKIRRVSEPLKEEYKEENKVDKEKILKLYKDAKNNKIDIHSLDIQELKMLNKLANEEINILKYKIENEVTEIKINERAIKDYRTRLAK